LKESATGAKLNKQP